MLDLVNPILPAGGHLAGLGKQGSKRRTQRFSSRIIDDMPLKIGARAIESSRAGFRGRDQNLTFGCGGHLWQTLHQDAGNRSLSDNDDDKKLTFQSCFKRQPYILLRQRCLRMLGGTQIVELIEPHPFIERRLGGKAMKERR
jgi:hypothetical protein